MKQLFSIKSIRESDNNDVEFKYLKFKEDLVDFDIDGQNIGCWKTKFYNCDFSNIKILNSEIKDCEFYNCNFKNTIIINREKSIYFSNFVECDFTNAYINQANFSYGGDGIYDALTKCKFDLDNKIFIEKNNWCVEAFNGFLKDFINENFIFIYKKS